MRVVIERESAAAAMARLADVVEERATLPILSNVLLRAANDRLTLQATDLDSEAMEVIDARVTIPGALCVSGVRLRDIARLSASGADIALAATDDGDGRALAQSGRSRYRLPVLPPGDFPTFSTPTPDGLFTLPTETLRDLLARSVWAIDRADPTTHKSVVYLAAVEGELHAVACSGRVAALRTEPTPEGAAGFAAIIPGKLAGHLIRWLGDPGGGNDVVEIGTLNRGRLIRLTRAGSTLVAKLDGSQRYAFPRYPAILRSPLPEEVSATIERAALTAAVRRVRVMEESRSSGGSIRVTVSPGCAELALRGCAGEGVAEIACDYDGARASALVSAADLEGALGAIRGEYVRLRFAAAPAADMRVLIDDPDDAGFAAVSAQMRV